MHVKQIYDSLMSKAKVRNWSRRKAPCYVEKHHIVPRSLGGRDEKSNYVFLTGKEHYISHLLLTKIYITGIKHEKMISAFMRMCRGNEDIRKHVNGRTYQKLREEYSKQVSRRFSGNNHPMFGKTHSIETKAKLSQLRNERIILGTTEGHRIPHSEESKKKMSTVKKGKLVSEETRRKRSESLKGHEISEETAKKISNALKGRTMSPEHREKLSIAAKARWNKL